MIEGYGPVTQALFGTLFTWGLTAAGAALVFVFTSGKRKILDGSLGFAAGVMLAASYWSLLAPAIEMAKISGSYGEDGQFAFVPVAIGFFLGAIFVYGADVLMPWLGVTSPETALALHSHEKVHDDDVGMTSVSTEQDEAYWLRETTVSGENSFKASAGIQEQGKADENNADGYHSGVTQRKKTGNTLSTNTSPNGNTDVSEHQRSLQTQRQVTWKRILLLIIAITIHNIPEGLAVGVGFGAIGKTPSATLESARNLALGIGIQNFPEGLAVSLPLRGSGYSTWKSFWYGQLSGMVEPIAGVFGAVAVVIAEPLLPYALAFAAGAMVYVVVDDIIPESQTSGNGLLASWGVIAGFVVMMSLDVGLG